MPKKFIETIADQLFLPFDEINGGGGEWLFGDNDSSIDQDFILVGNRIYTVVSDREEGRSRCVLIEMKISEIYATEVDPETGHGDFNVHEMMDLINKEVIENA